MLCILNTQLYRSVTPVLVSVDFTANLTLLGGLILTNFFIKVHRFLMKLKYSLKLPTKKSPMTIIKTLEHIVYLMHTLNNRILYGNIVMELKLT